jgi:hypothetical protein
MPSIDVAFTRALLAEAHKLVKQHFPDTNLKQAWVYKYNRDHWEFHGPDGFYWHGSAGTAYDARYKGWMSWLRHNGINLD